MLPLPDQRLHPRDAARLAAAHFGRALTVVDAHLPPDLHGVVGAGPTTLSSVDDVRPGAHSDVHAR